MSTHAVAVRCQHHRAILTKAARSPCPGEPAAEQCGQQVILPSDYTYTEEDEVHGEVRLSSYVRRIRVFASNTAWRLNRWACMMHDT